MRGHQRADGGGEQGQRQEQQLHEEAAATDEEAADEQGEQGEQGADGDGADASADVDAGTGAGAGAALDLQLDEGRLLGQGVDGGSGRRAPTKRLGSSLEDGEGGEGGGGLGRLSLMGLLLWMGALVLAFMLLPWAKRKGRHRGGAHHALASPLRPSGKGRDD